MSFGCDEPNECPLCMEPLELDDLNFFPCTCGYQICRFCWHRIRTDDNSLCPACRKVYTENPAEFKPLTDDELQRIKKERRNKDCQRKQKAAESRKHLANVRVLQKNLVFVLGLSPRLADAEVLKRNEYFGKFGKIHKLVINHSSSQLSRQQQQQHGGASASAYVTYYRPDDALRAIQAVNNIYVDGRTIKASLGTTKYCSHFLKGTQCPKSDCMYLHELGDDIASFTKDEMQQGKHTDYENSLYETFMNSQNLDSNGISVVPVRTTVVPSLLDAKITRPGSSPEMIDSGLPPPGVSHHWQSHSSGQPIPGSAKFASTNPDGLTNGSKCSSSSESSSPPSSSSSPPPTQNHKPETQNAQHRAPGHQRTKSGTEVTEDKQGKSKVNALSRTTTSTTPPTVQPALPLHPRKTNPYPGSQPHNSMSLFSESGFSNSRNPKPPVQNIEAPPPSTTEIPDTIAVSSTTDWQAAFGFTATVPALNTVTSSEQADSEDHIDDDLGFDPWNESAKALADLMEKEVSSAQPRPPTSQPPGLPDPRFSRPLPPGFSPNHVHNGSLHHMGIPGSKMMGLMALGAPAATPAHHYIAPAYHEENGHLPSLPLPIPQQSHPTQNGGMFNMKDWQEGLRALLPNINISFGAAAQHSVASPLPAAAAQPLHSDHSHATQKSWSCTTSTSDLPWDPAIVTSGNIAPDNGCDEPHWMASLHHLTEDVPHTRLPYHSPVPSLSGMPVWSSQAAPPPPGFHPAPLHTAVLDGTGSAEARQ